MITLLKSVPFIELRNREMQMENENNEIYILIFNPPAEKSAFGC